MKTYQEVERDHAMDEFAHEAFFVQVRREEFRAEVLEKLGRLEAKMDMLAGGTQPGRMKMAEDRIRALEQNDIRRGVMDRIVSATIAFVVSAAIPLHDHLGFR